MPWAWRFWKRHHDDPPSEARALLARLHAQQPEVDRLTDAIEKRRAENHFREAVEQALRGGKTP